MFFGIWVNDIRGVKKKPVEDSEEDTLPYESDSSEFDDIISEDEESE